MMTNSTCYKGTREMKIKGVLWHSTGANAPQLKRYVQPSEDDPRREELLSLLGKNLYGNDWNHTERNAGLNCWVGRLASGEVATVQTMPWEFRPWGCGSGENGSCNSGWIQFEICEDDLTDRDYFDKVYREGCEITAYLCRRYGINPHGTVEMGGVTVPTILCHADSHELGLGSRHADVYHWFERYGKDMEDVRGDVAALLDGASLDDEKEEEEDVDVNRFKELWDEMRQELRDNDSSQWSEQARQWAVSNGLVEGGGGQSDGQTNFMWQDVLTREQLVVVLYRFAQMIGKT